MSIRNEDIASVFDRIADLLDIEAANPFRVRAYRNGARTVRGLGREVSELVAEGNDLKKLPGIGKELAHKIDEILHTGTVKALEELHETVPDSLEALLRIPSLGPKRVNMLFKDLGIQDLEQLEKAARKGRLRVLPGFGIKTEQHILDSIDSQRVKKQRVPRATAMQYAQPLVSYLEGTAGVKDVVLAGSYRRGSESVGDLDILATAKKSSSVMERFVSYEDVADVVSKGGTRATVILGCGLQVDLRVVEKDSFGSALHYFTGNKAHNIQIRRLGQQAGLKINEYGVFRGKKHIAGKTEASVFKAVGLPFIPPELREGRGEVEAARLRRLPKLVELADLKGSLHTHTTATDGRASLRDMALAAKERGYDYLAITDHSQRLTMVNGLDAERLLQQVEQIDRLNQQIEDITILKGIEVDILEDGALDLPNQVLSRLDLVIGAVHGYFNLSRKKQTVRILRAMDNRYFSILAHPTGRLLNAREAYDVDVERIIRNARERGCFLELNSQPKRLDLDDVYCRVAKQEGVMISINSDAHSEKDLDNLHFGISQARRAWLEKADVLNTRSVGTLKQMLKQTMV